MNVRNLIRSVTATPQTAPMPARVAEQVPNSAGGFVWRVDLWQQLERFLILGSEGGTYYIAEPKLTADNAACVLAALREDGPRVVDTAVEVSESGRAPRNSPALFVLALASAPQFADAATVTRALGALPRVARTASDLCTFVEFVQSMRGWGRGLRNAIAEWYTQRPASGLAYQLTKYRERSGWSHRDLLRVSHAQPPTPEHNVVFRWAVAGEVSGPGMLLLNALEAVKLATSEREVVRLIETHGLTHELVPNDWKRSAEVWEALLPNLPYKALVRNLGRLTELRVLAPASPSTALAVLRLTDRTRIENARVHPVALLSALAAYKAQRRAVGAVVDALDEAFHLAFAAVQPTGRRVCVAIDASGSMQSSACAGLRHVTAAMGAAAMAMSFARSERWATIVAFHEAVWNVDISANGRLDRAVAAIVHEPRATDASLPMKWAAERGLQFDAFVLITDNETWAGDRHPAEALAAYRRKTGIAAKLVSVAMAANQFTVADPKDPLQLDVVGFDASVPAVVANFIRG